jgi:hypothetical protein
MCIRDRFNRCMVGIVNFVGQTPWERHPDDERFRVIYCYLSPFNGYSSKKPVSHIDYEIIQKLFVTVLSDDKNYLISA